MKVFKTGLVVLFFAVNIYAETNSFTIKEPKTPVVSGEEKSTNKIKSNIPERNKSDNNLYIYKVTFIFADKTILSGITSFTKNSLRVTHIKKGFLFKKRLDFGNVRSIKILEWQPNLIKGKSNSKSLLYYFYPYKFEIIDKHGNKYKYKGNVDFLNKLILTNNDGSTEVYTYFADYWNITGKNIGYWKNSKSTLFYYPFKNPLKRVIKIINFR